jgi:ATP-dependent helicase HrpB
LKPVPEPAAALALGARSGHNSAWPAHYPRAQHFGLPIEAYIEEIAALLRRGSLALSAETGAGKTTALQAALALRYAEKGRILVLEPRRLAAIGAAQRCAELLGEPVGATAGYRVRGDTKAGPATRLEFMTVAVFLRIVQDDPFLEGVRLVVFDEFHERSAVGDLCLAFAREAAELREGLSLLVMSATLEADGVADYLGCPVLSVPGRAFPVELAYRPLAPGQEPAEAAARAAAELYAAQGGSILVFLPGRRELNEAQSMLAALAPEADTRLLYGALPLESQRAVIAPAASKAGGQPKRIILATSIAETSLTVPGVVAVVDAGLARFTRYHERGGMNRLVTERVSAAEAEQRRGRAGRLRPGFCLRCWSPDDRLKSQRDPEILRTELAGLALECALRGDSGGAALRWLTAPPPSAWESGRELLRELGLLNDDYAISERGIKAAALGVEPRSAAALLAAAPGDRQAAALCAALLGEGAAGSGQGPEADLRERFDGATENPGASVSRRARGGGTPVQKGLWAALRSRRGGRSGRPLRRALGAGLSRPHSAAYRRRLGIPLGTQGRA